MLRLIRIYSVLLVLLVASATWSSPAAQVIPVLPPDNDDFADAIEPAGLPYTQSVVADYATLEDGEPQPSCRDATSTVWYRHTAAADGVLRVQVDPERGDPVVAIYEGTSLGSLTELDCDFYYDVNNGRADATGRIEAGNTYYIQVGMLWGDSRGAYALEILAPSAGLPNDLFADAEEITTWPITINPNNGWATRESAEPRPSCLYYSHDFGRTLWYKFSTTTDRILSWESGPDWNYYRFAAFYQGSSLDSLTEQACRSDLHGINDIQFRIPANTTYYIQLGSYHGYWHNIVDLDFSAAMGSPVSNDDRLNAIPVGSLPATVAGDTTWATEESDELTPSCLRYDEFGRSLWYSFTATENGTLRLRGNHGPMDVLVGLYELDAANDTRAVGCFKAYEGGSGNTAAHAPMVAGTRYLIQAGGWAPYRSPAEGAFSFTIDSGTPPANDDFANAVPIASLPFTHTVDLTYASRQPGEEGACHSSSLWVRPGSVWYSYTALRDETLVFADGVDAAVYVGSALGSLSTFDCPRPSEDTFVDAGTTYFIQIVGGVGTKTLAIERVPAIANDDFADAVVLTGARFDVDSPLASATMEPGEPPSSCLYAHNPGSAWYKFQAPEWGRIRVTADGPSAAVGLYSGSSLASLSEVACYRGYPDTSFVRTLAAGTELFIQLVGPDRTAAQGFHFEFQGRLPHDHYANARAVTGPAYSDEIDTLAATREAGENTDCGNPRFTAWYKYTPDRAGLITASTTSPEIRTVVAAYTGPSARTALPLACDEQSGSVPPDVRFHASPGVTYYFQVSGLGDQSGDIEFAMDFEPTV